MKITKVDAQRHSGDAEAAYVAEIVVVGVRTDEGVTGMGFASAPPGVGVLFKQIIENVLAPKLVGADPQFTTELWDRMYQDAIPRRGGEGIVRICISALDMALWDIKGKAAGVPVATLLALVLCPDQPPAPLDVCLPEPPACLRRTRLVRGLRGDRCLTKIPDAFLQANKVLELLFLILPTLLALSRALM